MSSNQDQVHVTLTVIKVQGDEVSYSSSVKIGWVLLGVLNNLQETDKDFRFTYMIDNNFGIWLESVNGLAGSDAKETYWQILSESGGKRIPIELGIGAYMPKENDHIILEFTTRDRSKLKKVPVNLTVIDDKGEETPYSSSVIEGGVLLGALNHLMKTNENFKFKYTINDFGICLESVNGLAGCNANKTYWKLLSESGGKRIPLDSAGIGTYQPKPDEHIIMQFTTWDHSKLKKVPVNLTVIDDKGEETPYSSSVIEGGVLLGALNHLMETNENFKFKYTINDDFGICLESVNGLAGCNANKTYWKLLSESGGKRIPLDSAGIGTYQPKPDEHIIMQFTTWDHTKLQHIPVKVTVIEDTVKKDYIGSVMEGAVLFGVLNNLQDTCTCFKFTYKVNDYGIWLDSVNGVYGKKDKTYWCILSGDEPLKVGIGIYQPKENECITLKFTKWGRSTLCD